MKAAGCDPAYERSIRSEGTQTKMVCLVTSFETARYPIEFEAVLTYHGHRMSHGRYRSGLQSGFEPRGR